MDTANNAPRSRYLARSHDVRLQWVTRLPRLPSWIQVHLKTVEGRALLTLDQAWHMWTLLQPDDERLQSTRVLPEEADQGPAVGSPVLPILGQPHWQLVLVLFIYLSANIA